MSYEARIKELGIVLPTVAAPIANYVPAVLNGNTLYVSGQLPFTDGKLLHLGLVGDTVSEEEAYAAARLCAVNIIAQVRATLQGDLDRVARLLRLGGFVASTPSFTRHPEVINGASDLMAEVFQEAGKHSRFAVGVAALPRGVSVEVDATFAVNPA